MKKPKASLLSGSPRLEALSVPVPTNATNTVHASKEKNRLEKTTVAKRVQKTLTKKRKALVIADSSPNIARKIKIVENFSKRKPVTRKTATLKDKVHVNASTNIIKSTISVALLSPFRNRVNHALLASSVARYAGVALVIVGGIFTMYGMDILTSGAYMNSSSNVATTCVPGTYCGTDGTSPTPNDTIPSANIGINTSSAVLAGTIQVTVTVPLATRVDVLAVRTDSGHSETLGTLEKISDTVWQRNWNTINFDDASYRLKAVIVNQYGSYDTTGTMVYTVQNNSVDGTETGGTVSTGTTTESGTGTGNGATTTTSSPTQTTTEESIDVDVTLSEDEPLSGVVTISTVVDDVVWVKHFYRSKNSSQYTLLGSALYKEADDKWTYAFDTTHIPNGTYNVRTQIGLRDNRTHIDTRENVDVENTVSSTTATTVDIPPTEPMGVVTTEASPLSPLITLEIPTKNPQRGSFDVFVRVLNATFVELYALPNGGLSPRFLGLASPESVGIWKYRFNTSNLPNGTYELYANVRHQYGDSMSEKKMLTIENESSVTPTQTQTDKQTVLLSLGTDISKISLEVGFTNAAPVTETPSSSSQGEADSSENTTDSNEGYTEILQEQKQALDEYIDEYARALRKQDNDHARSILEELERTRDTYIRSLTEKGTAEEDVSNIKEALHKQTARERERAERSETLIRERIGEARFDDDDKDGVSNYDEVNLYTTDPFSGDTDNDGFTDGAEIAGGYNPIDASREAYITYESPKDAGVTREDILTVESITKLSLDDSVKNERAHISGKALPHSFVTLYIFSTPIVVTVRTDANGAWSYIFDKELEDGTHEVYAGMTDNAGRIVAKSAPLTFVKTAEAFTPIDEKQSSAQVTTPSAPSLMDGRVAFVIGSLAIVGLGLVLILLGLHVRPKMTEPVLAS